MRDNLEEGDKGFGRQYSKGNKQRGRLQSARYHVKHFTYLISFKHHNNTLKYYSNLKMVWEN